MIDLDLDHTVFELRLELHQLAREQRQVHDAAVEVQEPELRGKDDGQLPAGPLLGELQRRDQVHLHLDLRSEESGERCGSGLTLVHLPKHASWLNQIEIYFSILQRKALTPADFASQHAVAARILGFQDHYQAIAKPFQWKFTRRDLRLLLQRWTLPHVQPSKKAA
ncbi:MAG: transposase [Thioalkalivibrio sp.]|nr:transposase [Thioalkalivibrio sp.]